MIHDIVFSYEILTELAQKYSNDQDLGKNWRSICLSIGKLDKFCLDNPNDFDLGSVLRKKVNKLN
jgi:hypothetical protein